MNNKGYTLIELIITVAILAIITFIVFPTVLNIQAENNQTKYETYQESIEYAGKLYVDIYQKDLFTKGQAKTCVITYDNLLEEDLIKDITIDDITCQNDTVIEVKYSSDNKLEYDVKLVCERKSDKSNTFGKNSTSSANNCDGT